MTTLKESMNAGRIANSDSLKHLCRKLTKEIVTKERKRGNPGRWNAKIEPAARKFVEGYMASLFEKGILCYEKKE
jgi:hypothetical protein